MTGSSAWWLDVGPALLLGLLGATHCLAMCGGIMAALHSAGPAGLGPRARTTLLYNAGRISSYTLLGGLLAALGGQLPDFGFPWGRVIAGILMIAVGLYVAGWWMGLSYLERWGAGLWRRLRPLVSVEKAQCSRLWMFLLGALWGWLPCGLVYTALTYAITRESAGGGALVMLCFGLGTLPAVASGGMLLGAAGQWFRRRQLRQLLAVGYIAFGLWTLVQAILHTSHSGHDPAPVVPGDPPVHGPHLHHH